MDAKALERLKRLVNDDGMFIAFASNEEADLVITNIDRADVAKYLGVICTHNPEIKELLIQALKEMECTTLLH